MNNHKYITFLAHGFIFTFKILFVDSGFHSQTKSEIIQAVTSHQIKAAGKINKNSWNCHFQADHAIRVVISQNGLHDHQAFDATTIFTAIGTSILGFFDKLWATVDNISAVVKLSATGDIKKAKNPKIQNNFL